MATDQYKFPDEIEQEEQNVVVQQQPEDSDVEIEIVEIGRAHV